VAKRKDREENPRDAEDREKNHLFSLRHVRDSALYLNFFFLGAIVGQLPFLLLAICRYDPVWVDRGRVIRINERVQRYK